MSDVCVQSHEREWRGGVTMSQKTAVLLLDTKRDCVVQRERGRVMRVKRLEGAKGGVWG